MDHTLTRIYPSKWINFWSKSIKWGQDHEITCVFLIFYREENADSDAGISKHARIKDWGTISWVFSLLRERSREYTEKSCMINQEIGSYTNKNISIQMNQFLQQKYQIGSRSWNYLCFSYFLSRGECWDSWSLKG